MAFVGNSFTFDNISSERYGLFIITKDSKDTVDISDYKSDVIKTNRQSKFHPLKQTIEKPSEIPISICSETPLSRNQLDQIDSWLFRNDGKFRKLRINQEDMEGYYYNCRLINLSGDTFANNIHVINAVMQCDSIYAWANPQTRVINITSTPTNFKFTNISSEDMLKPVYTIKVGMVYGLLGGEILNNRYIKITDTTTNEYMELSGLLDNEIIKIDTEHEIITSDKRTSGVLDLFNKNFMRLSRGKHEFLIEGDILEFKMMYQNARKIGN